MRFKLLIGLTSTTATMGLTLSTVYASAVQYTVRNGDCLYGIAQRYHTSVSSIQSWNHLHTTLIHPGQKLVVGQNTSSRATTSAVHSVSRVSSASTSTYTVHSGDTLWSIGQRYHVSVSNLMSWNHMSSHSILHVGQRLTLKGGSSTLGSRSGSPDAGLAAGLRGYEAAQYARKFVGVPYRWGGTSPAGFDCSGFVWYVYAHESVRLPRTSYDQYGVGSSVSRGNLQPGDMVFFNTFGVGASHVGIYVGNDQFINAASRQVEVDSLSSGYWSGHYVGARRV